MSLPAVHVYVQRIAENARRMTALCAAQGIHPSVVTKVCAGYRPVAEALTRAGITDLCESRLENARAFAGLGASFCLIREPMISEADAVVRHFSASLNSERAVLKALDEAAGRAGVRHGVLLMAEIGDLREGALKPELLELAKGFPAWKNLDFLGIGANLSCYGGIIPSAENMADLVALAEAVEQETGLVVSTISGGNSSSLKMLLAEELPPRINHLRLGESVFLGNIPCFEEPLPGFHRDNFILEAEIVELKEKPSVPWGTSLVDSFGHAVTVEDRGVRKRAIAAIGKQDLDLDGTTPLDPGISILGGSSDHLLLDVTDAETPLAVGDSVQFSLNYAATLRVMTSPYVKKIAETGN